MKKNLQYFIYARNDRFWFSMHRMIEGTSNSVMLYRRDYDTPEEAVEAANQALQHEYDKVRK